MAILFDIVGEGIKRTANVVAATADYTVMAWWRTNAAGSFRAVFAQMDGGANYAGVFYNGAGTLFFEAYNGVSTSDANAYVTGLVTGEWLHVTYTRTGTTHKWYINGALISTVTFDLSAVTFTEVHGGTANVRSNLSNHKLFCIREWTTVLTASEIIAERDATAAVKTASLLSDTSLSTDLVDASGNGNDWTAIGAVSFTADPTLASIPKNTVTYSATPLASGTKASPTNVTQDVYYDGVTYVVYYAYANLLSVAQVVSYGNWGPIPESAGVTYRPFVEIYANAKEDAPDAFVHQGFYNGSFSLIPIPIGYTYYFKVKREGTINPSLLNLTFFLGPSASVPVGTIFIFAASIATWQIDAGLQGLAGGFIDADLGEIVSYVPQFMCGEWGDILPVAQRILTIDQYGIYGYPAGLFDYNVYMYGATFELVDPAPITTVTSGTGNLDLTTHIQTDKWYLFGTIVGANTAVQFKTVAADGTVSAPTNTTATGQSFMCGAASADEAIVYIGQFDGSVKQWDVGAAAYTTDLVGATAGYKVADIMVLDDGTILVVFLKKTLARDTYIKRYDPAGTVLNTYTAVFSGAISSVNPRLGQSASVAGAFWILNHLAAGYCDIRLIRVSDGATLKGPSITGDPNLDDDPTDAPVLPRTSDSCPIIEILALFPPPSLSTIIVVKDAGGDTVQPFTIDAGGGLDPTSVILHGGESHSFTVSPGSGYSIDESIVPSGWALASIVVDNGDSPSDITVAAGDIVTVTVTNTPADECPGLVNGPRIDGAAAGFGETTSPFVEALLKVKRPKNQPPRVSLTLINGVTVDDTWVFGIAAQDSDGVIRSYRIRDSAGGDTGTITGVPPATYAKTWATSGTKTVTVTVTDNAGASAMASVSLNVQPVTTTIPPPPPNQPPVAVLSYVSGQDSGLPYVLSSAGSMDPDGSIVSAIFNPGDGSGAFPSGPLQPTYTHVYAAPGTFPATLQVTDNLGLTNTATRNVTIQAAPVPNQPPVPVFAFVNGQFAGDNFTFSSQGSFDPDGSIVSASVNWGDGSPNTGPAALVSTYIHQYLTAGTFTVQFSVTDNAAATSTATRTVTVQAVVIPPQPNQVPIASMIQTGGSTAGDTFTFSTVGTRDTDGTIVSWAFVPGDGSLPQGGSGIPPLTISHIYLTSGTSNARLTVTDDGGLTNSVAVAVPVAPRAVQTVSVLPGGDLQAALDAALPGDVIVLQAGGYYPANVFLPNKIGSTFITIKSSGAYPAPGVRVSPADAPQMAALQSPSYSPAMQTLEGAHHWRLEGVEFRRNLGIQQDAIINIGYGDGTQHLLSQVPHDIVVDRCYVHGDPGVEVIRGIGLHGAIVTIANSYLSEFKIGQADSRDSQAIGGWNGPGPYVITNNYLEASGENILFGGATAYIPNCTPSDITVRGNTFAKQPSWRVPGTVINGQTYSGPYVVKNLFELKHAQRVLVENNIFEYCWQDAQQFAFALTPRSAAAYPWAVVADVTIQDNIIRHVGNVFNVLTYDTEGDGGATARNFTIRRNLCYDVSASAWGNAGDTNGHFMQVIGPTSGPGAIGFPGLVVDHNTCIFQGPNNNSWLNADSAPNPGTVFTNNIFTSTDYGIIGTGTGPGNSTVGTYFPASTIQGNVFTGADAGSFPAANYYPATVGAIGFTNYGAGDYTLAPTSPYVHGATDGGACGYAASSAPIVVLQYVSGTVAGDVFRFSTVGTGSPSGTIIAYRFDPGDGTPPQTGSTPPPSTLSHVYAAAGDYLARLTITDNLGNTVASSDAAGAVHVAAVTPPVVGAHPYLWFDTTVLARVRAKRLASDPDWVTIKAQADASLAIPVPAFTVIGASNTNPVEFTILENVPWNGTEEIYIGGGTGPWAAVNMVDYPGLVATKTGTHTFTVPINSSGFGSFSGQSLALFPYNSVSYAYQGGGWYDLLFSMALVYQISGTAAYGTRVGQWLDYIATLGNAGIKRPSSADSYFPSRFLMSGIAFAFDWAYAALSAGTKARIASCGNFWFDDAKAHALEWNGPLGSNYYTGHLFGWGTFGAATFGDNARASEISATMRSQYDSYGAPSWLTSSAGGYPFEAFGYGTNGYERLLWYFEAVRTATGENLANEPQLLQALIYNLRPDRWRANDEGDYPGGYVGVVQPDYPITLHHVLPSPYKEYAKWFYDHMATNPYGTSAAIVPTIPRLLWYDTPAPSTDYRVTYPVGLFSAGDQRLYRRADWTDAAVWASFNGAAYNAWGGHQARTGGHLEIQRGVDNFLVYAGQWKGTDGISGTPEMFQLCGGLANAIFHADGGVYNFTGPAYFGGQGYWGDAVNVQGSTIDIDGVFAYAQSDLVTAYHTNAGAAGRTLTALKRSVVFAGSGVVVVFDYLTRGSTAYTDEWRWHLHEQATVSQAGGVVTASLGASKLFLKPLLPATPTIVLGRDFTDVVTDSGAPTTNRVKVSDGGAPSTTLRGLNLFYISGSGLGSIPANALITAAGATHYGVSVVDGADTFVVLFSANGTTQTTVSY